eukprot:6368639-Prymnesium_polylepis.1
MDMIANWLDQCESGRRAAPIGWWHISRGWNRTVVRWNRSSQLNISWSHAFTASALSAVETRKLAIPGERRQSCSPRLIRPRGRVRLQLSPTRLGRCASCSTAPVGSAVRVGISGRKRRMSISNIRGENPVRATSAM